MIDRLWPDPRSDLDEDALASAYGDDRADDAAASNTAADGPGARSSVRFNFVASADGAATLHGHSGGLGSADDQRILRLLRRSADAVLLGAGTVRAEGYGGDLLSADGRAWRRRHAATAHPALAVVSGSLALDPGAAFFRQATTRPLVFTTEPAAADPPDGLAAVADIVAAGADEVEPARVLEELSARGLRRILSEGGPHLFGAFLRAGAVGELCLSVSPMLVGGPNPRITVGTEEAPEPAPLALAQVLRSADMLFLRYRAEAAPQSTRSSGRRADNERTSS